MPTLAANNQIELYVPLASSMTFTPASGFIEFGCSSPSGTDAPDGRKIYAATTITVPAGSKVFLRAVGGSATYTDPAGVDTALEALVSGAGNTIAVLGASRQAFGYTTSPTVWKFDMQGFFVVANQIATTFQITANFAVAGTFINDVRDTQLPKLLAMPNRPKYAVIEAGYNDINGGTQASAVIASATSVIAALYAAGIKVILCTLSSSTTIAASLQNTVNLRAYNKWLLNTASTLPGVVKVLDVYSVTVDPATGGFLAALQTDGTHPSYQGSQVIGKAIAPELVALMPSISPFVGDVDNSTQLIPNPRLVGTGGTIGTGCTGTPPDNWGTTRTGTATSAFTSVARTDGLTGNLAKTAHAAGAAYDQTRLTTANILIRTYAASTAYALATRIRPTVANGYHYVVTTAGSTTTGDPTAGWSTVLGASFTVNGTLVVKVVEAIDVGDAVQLVVELFADSWTGGAAFYCDAACYTAGAALLFTGRGGFADNTYALPTLVPPSQVLRTPQFVIPATTGIVAAEIRCVAAAAAAGNWSVGRVELQKVAAATAS